VSKQPKAPKGCYWREGVLWGRIQAGGRDYRWSLRTDDPKVARDRRKIERDRVVASHHYGDHRRTLSEAVEAWGRFIKGPDREEDVDALPVVAGGPTATSRRGSTWTRSTRS
jgi:hypothetical protein